MTKLAGWNERQPDRRSKPTSRRRVAAPPHSADDRCLAGKSISPMASGKSSNSKAARDPTVSDTTSLEKEPAAPLRFVSAQSAQILTRPTFVAASKQADCI